MRKRKHKRIPLARYFEVVDVRTGEPAVHLDNISGGGALVHADKPADMGRRLLPMLVVVQRPSRKWPVNMMARSGRTVSYASCSSRLALLS